MKVTFQDPFVFVPPENTQTAVVYAAGRTYANVRKIAVEQAKARGVRIIERRGRRTKRSGGGASGQQEAEATESDDRDKRERARPGTAGEAIAGDAANGEEPPRESD